MKASTILCIALALGIILAIDAKSIKGKKKSKQPKVKNANVKGETRDEELGKLQDSKDNDPTPLAGKPVPPAPAPIDGGSADGSDDNEGGEEDESEDVEEPTKNDNMDKSGNTLMLGQSADKVETENDALSAKEDEPLVFEKVPIVMGGHPHPGPPSAVNPNPEPRYCPGNCDQNCAPTCMDFCCERSVQLPRPPPGVPPSPLLLQSASPQPLPYGQTPVVTAPQPCGVSCKKHKIAKNNRKEANVIAEKKGTVSMKAQRRHAIA